MPEGFFPGADLAKKQPLPLVARCGACGFYKTCLSPKMPVAGKGRKGIMVVGEAPGQDEDNKGKPFVGRSGQLLQDVVEQLGFDLFQDCFVTNSAICRPPNNRMGKKTVEYCRPNLIQAIHDYQPHTIILLGGSPIKSVIGWLWKEDVGAVLRWVGWNIPNQRLNTWICPTWHPAHILRMDKQQDVATIIWKRHLKRALSHSSNPCKQSPIDYAKCVLVEMNPDIAADRIRALTSTNSALAFDYETDRLKPDHSDARILTCSISNGETAIAYPWIGKAIQATKEFLFSNTPKIGWNCFSGNTRFLTREYGVVSFSKVAGKTVTVLNHKGKWVKATIKSFGYQETVEVSFSRRNYQNTVRVTDSHEWVDAEGGPRLRTDQFKRYRYGGGSWGPHRVPYQNAPKLVTDQSDYLAGIRHGIVLGDGNFHKKAKKTGLLSFQLRLCGQKVELLKYFDGFTRSYPPSYGGDPMIYITQQVADLKQLPSAHNSDSYLIGFFRGLMATDGTLNNGGQISICNEKKVIKWCKRVLPRVGYNFQNEVAYSKYAGKYSGGYRGTQDSRSIALSRESITKEDLLRAAHRSKYKEVFLGPYKFSKRGERREEEVFCAVVPDGHSFTLEGGLVTGNCKFEDRWTRKMFGRGVKNWQDDGMLASHVLDNRNTRPSITSLKFQAFVQLGIESYDDALKPYMAAPGSNERNRLHEVPIAKLLLYNGMDALLEWHVARKQAPLFERMVKHATKR